MLSLYIFSKYYEWRFFSGINHGVTRRAYYMLILPYHGFRSVEQTGRTFIYGISNANYLTHQTATLTQIKVETRKV